MNSFSLIELIIRIIFSYRYPFPFNYTITAQFNLILYIIIVVIIIISLDHFMRDINIYFFIIIIKNLIHFLFLPLITFFSFIGGITIVIIELYVDFINIYPKNSYLILHMSYQITSMTF